jgi:uncharacterized protein YkwD
MTVRKYLTALMLVTLCAAVADAGPPRRYRSNRMYYPTESYWQPMTGSYWQPMTGTPFHSTYYPPTTSDYSPSVYPQYVYPSNVYPATVYSQAVASPTVYAPTLGAPSVAAPMGTMPEGSFGGAGSGEDALAEVNATRAQRGLPPFLPDPMLNQAAQACAKQRAARGIDGHLPESDFAYLPAGTTASAAGCAAWDAGSGWGSCCTYDHYTYAGAAWSMGNDGRRYMHLFVR